MSFGGAKRKRCFGCYSLNPVEKNVIESLTPSDNNRYRSFRKHYLPGKRPVLGTSEEDASRNTLRRQTAEFIVSRQIPHHIDGQAVDVDAEADRSLAHHGSRYLDEVAVSLTVDRWIGCASCTVARRLFARRSRRSCQPHDTWHQGLTALR